MCEFCENYSEHKAFYVPVRNTYADDNVCETIKGDPYSCEDCMGCADEIIISHYINMKTELV